MDILERLPEFSSFQSCIKYYGRSILPPLVSLAKKYEINEFRHKANIVQARLEQKQLENFCICEEDTEIHKALGTPCPDVLVQDVDDADMEELSSSRNVNETMPFSISINSNSSLEEIREEEEEAVATPSDKKPCDNVDQRNVIFRNSLLDNVETFHKHVKHINDIKLFTYSNHERHVNELPYSYPFPVPATYQLFTEQLLTPTEISDDQRLSETEAEHQSIDTVLINTYEELGCNLDSDSVITSVAHSCDLDKYLDCSVEGSQTSEYSIAVSDGKDVTQCLDYTETTTSSDTIVDHSNASTPVVPLLLQSFTAENKPESTMVNPFNVTYPMQPHNDIDYGKGSKDCLLLSSPSNYFESKASNNSDLDSKQMMSTTVVHAEIDTNQVEHEEKGKPEAGRCSRHRRNNSYTLDTTSPALLKSHAGCPCLESPASSGIPHSTSIEFVKDSPSSDDGAPQQFATMDESLNDQSFCVNGDIYKEEIHSVNMTEGENKTNEVVTDSRTGSRNSSSRMLLDVLHETFKKIHEERMAKLLKEQNEQWAKLQQEFDEQEQKLREQIQSLHFIPADKDESSIQEFSSTIAQPPENSLEAEPVKNTQECSQGPKGISNQCTSKGTVHSDAQWVKPHSDVSLSPISIVANQNSVVKNCTKSEKRTSESDAMHLASVLKAVNDPDMKKKFEKVSAAAKGYLTRRLLKTVQLRELLKIVQDTAVQLAKHYEKSKGKYSNREDYLIHQGFVNQLNTACSKVYKIFFEISAKERMEIIAESRELEKEQQKLNESGSSQPQKDTTPPRPPSPAIVTRKNKLSSATLKRLERKRLKSLSSLYDWSTGLMNHEVSASIEKSQSAADLCLVGKSIPSKLHAHRRPHSSQAHCTSHDSVLHKPKVNGPSSRNCITPKVVSE